MLLWQWLISTGKRGHFIPTHTTATALGLCTTPTCKHGLDTPWTSAICPVQSGPTVHVAVHATNCNHPPWHQSCSIHCLPSHRPMAQTECVNQELEQYLHGFMNERQDDWDEWLPMAKFGIHNKSCPPPPHDTCHSSSTQGQHPHMGV